jgi:tRNA G46 methylase TrmB
MATDWQDYAQQMMEMLETNKNFKNTQSAHIYTPRPEFRPLSKLHNSAFMVFFLMPRVRKKQLKSSQRIVSNIST